MIDDEHPSANRSEDPLVRLPDGTVKQIGPLTGTRVWTVPGRAHRPIETTRPAARQLARGEENRLCAFCADRCIETTPEKARLVGPDFTEVRRVPARDLSRTVPEFRRFGNLFEIVSAAYWRENHGFRQPSSVVEWAGDYLDDPIGREHIATLAALRAERADESPSLEEAALDLLGGSHDVIVARRHVVDGASDADDLASSGTLTPEEHAAYLGFTVRTLGELFDAQPFARYIAVFQNWLRAAGASFDHLHKQLVAIDEYGPQMLREQQMLASDHRLYQRAIADLAVDKRLVVAATDHSVAFAGIGHRYPAFEVYSTAAAHLPFDHNEQQIRGMSDLLHALHAATGVHVPTNEEWHYRPPRSAWPMPWRIVLKWRISTPAGFEGGTKVYVNTIDPWSLRERAITELTRLRAEGRVSGDIRIGDECTAQDAVLHYAD